MQLLGIWVRERIEQMDLRKVKKLIELAEESDLAEIEVSGSDESVRIVRTVSYTHLTLPTNREV